MTNKTVLSDEVRQEIKHRYFQGIANNTPVCLMELTEQAVLQSPEIRQALADTKRLDFLADKNQTVANVLLPIDVVMNNMGDMRAAIDEVMEVNP